MVCDESGDACVDIPGCPGGTIAACADIDNNGVRDDNCAWWACVAETCVRTEIVFGEMGGQFGACPPDGAADGNDRFHALNCFANTGGAGGNYDCENEPPAALNVDAGGQFGSCAPDGVCDGNDAFHALNAFGGFSPCSCPLDGGPAPIIIPTPVAQTTLRLTVDRKRIQPGDYVHIDVWLTGGLADLRGYQLHLGAFGGRRGNLELVDISTGSDKAGSVLATADWSAFNLVTGQMLVGLDGPGVAVAGGHLATYTYRVSDDAEGRFIVELLHDPEVVRNRTFLFPTRPGTRIEIAQVNTVAVDVRSAAR